MSYPNARELVMTYGWNSTAYQVLNPGLLHWFAPDVPAVVAYIRRHNVFLVAGAPICAANALQSVVASFERFANEERCREAVYTNATGFTLIDRAACDRTVPDVPGMSSPIS